MDVSTHEKHVAVLRAQYLVSKNPCFAWHALMLIVQQPPPVILPDWVTEYLRTAGGEMFGAAMSMKPKEFGPYVSEALGFTRRGASAVSEWRDLETAENLLGHYELLKSAQTLRREAADAVGRKHSLLSPSEYAERWFSDRWNVTPVQARRRISAARRFLTDVARHCGKKLDLEDLREQAEGYADFLVDMQKMLQDGSAKHIPDQTAKERREAQRSTRAKGPANLSTRKPKG